MVMFGFRLPVGIGVDTISAGLPEQAYRSRCYTIAGPEIVVKAFVLEAI